MTDAEKLAEIARIVTPGAVGSADLDMRTLNRVRELVGVPTQEFPRVVYWNGADGAPNVVTASGGGGGGSAAT